MTQTRTHAHASPHAHLGSTLTSLPSAVGSSDHCLACTNVTDLSRVAYWLYSAGIWIIQYHTGYTGQAYGSYNTMASCWLSRDKEHSHNDMAWHVVRLAKLPRNAFPSASSGAVLEWSHSLVELKQVLAQVESGDEDDGSSRASYTEGERVGGAGGPPSPPDDVAAALPPRETGQMIEGEEVGRSCDWICHGSGSRSVTDRRRGGSSIIGGLDNRSGHRWDESLGNIDGGIRQSARPKWGARAPPLYNPRRPRIQAWIH